MKRKKMVGTLLHTKTRSLLYKNNLEIKDTETGFWSSNYIQYSSSCVGKKLKKLNMKPIKTNKKNLATRVVNTKPKKDNRKSNN